MMKKIKQKMMMIKKMKKVQKGDQKSKKLLISIKISLTNKTRIFSKFKKQTTKQLSLELTNIKT